MHNGSSPCYCVRIPVTFDDSIISKQEIDDYLDTLCSRSHYLSRAKYARYALALDIIPTTKRPKDFYFIKNILNDVTEFMRYYKLKFCCEHCGNSKYSSFFVPVIRENKISYHCGGCQSNLLLLSQDASSIKKRALRGTLGALLFSLPVFATHTFFLSYKVFSAEVDALMIMAIYAGYKTFNKHIDKFCYSICLSLCALETILSQYIGMVLSIHERSNESIWSIMARYSIFNIFTTNFLGFCFSSVVMILVIILAEKYTHYRLK
jgi:hypothetical protein